MYFVPTRSASRADITEKTIMVRPIGNIRIPASRAVKPSTDCRYWLMKNTDPNMLNITSTIAIFAPVNDIFLKKYRGNIGCGLRFSQRAKLTSSTMAAPNAINTWGAVQLD